MSAKEFKVGGSIKQDRNNDDVPVKDFKDFSSEMLGHLAMAYGGYSQFGALEIGCAIAGQINNNFSTVYCLWRRGVDLMSYVEIIVRRCGDFYEENYPEWYSSEEELNNFKEEIEKSAMNLLKQYLKDLFE